MPEPERSITEFHGDLTITVEHYGDGSFNVRASNDDWCQLRASRGQFSLMGGDGSNHVDAPGVFDAAVGAYLRERGLVAVDESRLRAVLSVGDFAVEEVLAHLTGRPVEG